MTEAGAEERKQGAPQAAPGGVSSGTDAGAQEGGVTGGTKVKAEGNQSQGGARVGAAVTGEVVSYLSDGALSVKATIGGKTFKGSIREIRGSGGFDPSRGGPVPVRTQPSVVVIGAGFAGLAAADELHALGCKVVVLEGRSRIGGRCWTDDSLGGRLVDLGAGWIHGVISNPIAELARRQGVEMVHIPSDTLLHDAEGKPVSDAVDHEVQQIFNDMLAQIADEMAVGRHKQVPKEPDKRAL